MPSFKDPELQNLDRELEGKLVKPLGQSSIMRLIRMRTGNANWVAGALTLVLILGLVSYSLMVQSANQQLLQQTCQGVLVGNDPGKLEFLGKYCVPR